MKTLARVCSWCQQGYAVPDAATYRQEPKSGLRFCSRACRGEATRAGMFGSKKVALACAWCEKPFTRYPSQAEAAIPFCSHACTWEAQRQGVARATLTDAGRAKLSKTCATAYAEGRLLAIPAYEHAIADWLTTRGIAFVHQFPLDTGAATKVVDFYLPDLRLIMELNDRSHYKKNERKRRDAQVEQWCREHGIDFVAIRYQQDVDDLKKEVERALCHR